MRCEIHEHIITKSLTHSLIRTIVCCAPADRVRYRFDFTVDRHVIYLWFVVWAGGSKTAGRTVGHFGCIIEEINQPKPQR